MAKKKAAGAQSKAAAKAAKKAKAAEKIGRKEKKQAQKSREDKDDDEDLEAILEKMQRDWEEAHKVTEEIVEGPPSRRANATLTPCPNGLHLWCIGGEFFSEDGKAYFYNDVFRYSPEKDEWRKFVSPECPGPRSAHAVVASPAGGGKLFLFGGEFSSLYQNTFHHYRDFWCFDVSTHAWDRIETKVRPSARSGHRMAMWKHYIFLFGGFYDPGIRTNYLNDLWYFDTQEYLWRQVEFKEADRRPSPRSGFSFLPAVDGIVLHGGYCKEYAKGKRPVGVMLEDTWFLRITVITRDNTTITSASASKGTSSKGSNASPLSFKWEKRKKAGYAPSLRSGCTMALWSAKALGVLFGGVTDDDNNEETLESVFHNDLYGYQLPGNGRWVSMNLKRPKMKKAGGAGKTARAAPVQSQQRDSDNEADGDDSDGDEYGERPKETTMQNSDLKVANNAEADVDPDDPSLSKPIPRYNAMLAVLGNTLYIYGGIFERGSREYTLDDFYGLRLDKLERYVCLKPCDVHIPKEGEADESSSEDDDDAGDSSEDEEELGNEEEDGGDIAVHGAAVKVKGEDDDSNDDREGDQEEIEKPAAETATDDLRAKAQSFMGVAKDATRSAEETISTPLPGETLAMFYARSREHWAGKAHESSTNRGKLLRRDGFSLAQERYESYKPILEEVERILAEAGLDEEEIKRSALAVTSGGIPQSRNRR